MIPRGPSDSRPRRGEASARSEGVVGVDWGRVGGILTDEATYGITLFSGGFEDSFWGLVKLKEADIIRTHQ